MSLRNERVRKELMRDISEIIRKEIRGIEGVLSIVDVEVSHDNSYAKVYYSVLGSEEQVAKDKEIIEKNTGKVRYEIGKRIRLRVTPEIKFVYSDGLEQGSRVLDLINKISKGEIKMFGFLNVYKPKGITSHDVVSALRRITKVKQIGHTGTLDPFAEGVLPICIGKATRLIEYLDDDKAYTGTIQLGSSTTTYDLEGEEVNFSDKKVTFNEIEAALDKFRGEIEQLPPIYSAIKVNGKKLYEYAREGKEVKIEPRGVNISNLQILNFYPETRQLELHIECSKGTYIRSIANDLGEELGTYGHLVKLVRVKAGMFEVNNAVSLEHIQTKEDVEKLLIAPLTKLNYMTYELNKNELVKVSNGTAIMPSKELPENSLILLTSQERLIAAAKMTKGLLKCLKVLG